jgi:hypothetical protein
MHRLGHVPSFDRIFELDKATRAAARLSLSRGSDRASEYECECGGGTECKNSFCIAHSLRGLTLGWKMSGKI